MTIDLRELEKALKEMQPRQKMYELIKAEMKRRNRWKGKARGNGFNKGHDQRRNT